MFYEGYQVPAFVPEPAPRSLPPCPTLAELLAEDEPQPIVDLTSHRDNCGCYWCGWPVLSTWREAGDLSWKVVVNPDGRREWHVDDGQRDGNGVTRLRALAHLHEAYTGVNLLQAMYAAQAAPTPTTEDPS